MWLTVFTHLQYTNMTLKENTVCITINIPYDLGAVMNERIERNNNGKTTHF